MKNHCSEANCVKSEMILEVLVLKAGSFWALAATPGGWGLSPIQPANRRASREYLEFDMKCKQ